MARVIALLLALSFLTQSETATVEGVVVRQGSSDPVQGAVVTFTPTTGTARTATSGEDGKFILANLTAGRYSVTSARTGFVKARRASGPANLTLTAGQRLADVRIQLSPTAVITGRVVDENGAPKASVAVSALRPEYQNGRRVLTCYAAAANARATTNANGEYRLFGLEPAEYYVAASMDGSLCSTSYYPGVSDPADAVLLTARAGAELGGIEIRQKPVARFTARFKVEASTPIVDRPVRQAQIVRISRNGLVVRESSIASVMAGNNFGDGSFATSPLIPGSYEIFYGGNSLGTEIGHAQFVMTDRDLDGGTIAIKRGVALGGQIRAPGGLPMGWAFNRSRIVLRPMDLRDQGSILGTAAAADGTFLLAFAPNTGETDRPGRVAEGRYLVSLSGMVEDQYLASARFKGAEVIDSGVVIDGSDPGPLELTIQNGGSLEGIVRNAKDEPVPDSRVVIVPAQNRRGNLNLFRTAFSDQYGRFSIRGVAPGEYGVLAWEDVENGAWESKEFLKDFESRATRVGVSAGAAASVNVRVIPAP